MINLHLITMALALVFFVSRDENHPPVVKIMQPKQEAVTRRTAR